MNLKLLALLATLFFVSNPALSTEYIYKTLMANTLPSAKCESLESAQKTASKPYKIKNYTKKFCQTQGYGWHVEEVVNKGEVACNECTDKTHLQKCYLKDVVVQCKRIKPGTVGMLPGKG
jgi:type III secretory pathway component EscR